jgi:hypothetical protein
LLASSDGQIARGKKATFFGGPQNDMWPLFRADWRRAASAV